MVEQQTLVVIALDDRCSAILLKNSTGYAFGVFAGVPYPLPNRRSSIVDRSDRSTFLGQVFQPLRTEFFNSIRPKRAIKVPRKRSFSAQDEWLLHKWRASATDHSCAESQESAQGPA
jgi:hypothetical protein